MGCEKSEPASITEEAGERTLSGPCGGKGLAELRNFLRERGEDIEPREPLNETREDSAKIETVAVDGLDDAGSPH